MSVAPQQPNTPDVTALLVDPRDVTREVTVPRYRVTLWSGEPCPATSSTRASREETYELQDVDVLGAIAWARARALSTPEFVMAEVVLVHDNNSDGLTAQTLWASDDTQASRGL